MIELVKVVQAKALDGQRVWLRFSNGREGIRDLSDVLAEGGAMVEPLRDPALFRRVFVECGVLAWPNGFDLDAIALHREMGESGLLTPQGRLTLDRAKEAQTRRPRAGQSACHTRHEMVGSSPTMTTWVRP